MSDEERELRLRRAAKRMGMNPDRWEELAPMLEPEPLNDEARPQGPGSLAGLKAVHPCRDDSPD
jgi:hypothetical protein